MCMKESSRPTNVISVDKRRIHHPVHHRILKQNTRGAPRTGFQDETVPTHQKLPQNEENLIECIHHDFYHREKSSISVYFRDCTVWEVVVLTKRQIPYWFCANTKGEKELFLRRFQPRWSQLRSYRDEANQKEIPYYIRIVPWGLCLSVAEVP